MKFSVKDFFSKCDQVSRKQRIWSHLLKKSLMENFIFSCSVRLSKIQGEFFSQNVNKILNFLSYIASLPQWRNRRRKSNYFKFRDVFQTL